MNAAEVLSDLAAPPRLRITAELRQFIPRNHREDATFAARILERLPSQFVAPVKAMYRDRYQREGGRAPANRWLLRVGDLMAGTSVRLAWDDAAITVAAEEKANQAGRIMAAAANRGADPYNAGAMFVRGHGVTPPEPGKQGRTREGCALRMKDAGWWRRQLRKRHGRAVETLARELNLVTRTRQCYASEAAVERRRSQKRRNRLMMEEMQGIAYDANGEEAARATLAELHDASVSNPELRRGELMCRLRGFEQAAKIAKHTALFITLTAPGEYHRAYSRTGQQNPNWNGSTPREVHQYLQAIWQRIRAAWQRRGIDVYGFRIAEPHHDGTPHWHFLAFVDRAREAMAIDAFGAVAGRAGVDTNGKGIKVERIDWKRGSAVGYVAKYVAKNIDGHALESDLLGNDGKTAAARIDAWASTWGIRQFQQFGGPPVTVWRELRRMREAPADRRLCLVWRAADRGKWRRYIRAMARVPVSLLRGDSGGKNRYGEIAPAAVVGVSCMAHSVVTRVHRWIFERAERATWTRVNNCTPQGGKDAAKRPIMRAGP